MKSFSSQQTPFIMLISSVHPDTDLIYQCHTNLCVKVKKRRLAALDSNTADLANRQPDKSVFIFEAVDNDRSDEKAVQAAIKWYFSYQRLNVPT